MALLVDPDVEALLIDYLSTALPANGIPNVPVSDRPPQTGVESVVLYRTGGVRRDLVSDQAQITVDVRAAIGSRAMTIIQRVRALLNDLWGFEIDGFAVYDVNELSGPYVSPTEKDAIRYSQSFLVVVRSKPLLPDVLPPVAATGAVAGSPGYWVPLDSTPPANSAALSSGGYTKSPSTYWQPTTYVVLGDGTNVWWDGAVWHEGISP